MEQTDKWQDFWREWRNKKIEKEEDLYFQVGRTTRQQPMAKELFDRVNQEIIEILSLNKNDVLIDLCCGNGLCTYEFRDTVKQIIAVDFAPQMIAAAKEFKSAPNITYCLDSVLDFLKEFKTQWNVRPGKFLMNGGLPYLTPEDLATILFHFKDIADDNFIAYFTIVPNDELKWNFYNTEERRQRYMDNMESGNFINDGIGRWWSPAEIGEICNGLGLKCSIHNQAPPLSDYRMDIIVAGGSYQL